MVTKIAAHLFKGIMLGHDNISGQPDYGTVDDELIKQLRENAYVFSAFKNHTEIQELVTSLIDENGKLRSFGDFKQAAGLINEKYNVNWLTTEYNLAVANGQMAATWVSIQANKKELPYLRYRTVGDELVREEHQLLDGIIRKVDDSFWLNWYPPNGWGCRCDVEQLPQGKETKNIRYPEQQPMFKGNVGISGKAFNEEHPYFKTAGTDYDEVYKEGIKLIPVKNNAKK